jgi:NAD(P)H-hydrate repair Nnr-like enzyme with NAD(P)H-hydrate dehydratase domain
MLFDTRVEERENRSVEVVKGFAKKHQCVIVSKGPKTIVCSSEECFSIEGGNPGLTVALLAKNDSFLAASAASYIAKKAGDGLHKEVGINYNADDLADKIPETLKMFLYLD